MQIGLWVPSYTWPGGSAAIAHRLAATARAAEEAGFASLFVMDHWFQIEIEGPVDSEMLEAYSVLAHLAAVTERVRLGTLVTGVTYRHPAVLVKTATTLDVLSGGRACLGVGAAWFEREHRGLGIPFPPLGERLDRLEETIRIAKTMWSAEAKPFAGRYYQLEEPLCVPQPLSRPHPPILIGGGGERRTLRLVAEHADACNLFTYDGLERVRHKLSVLRSHCDAVGRPWEEIERTTLSRVDLRPGAMTPSDVIRHCRALAGLGVQHAIVHMPDVHELAPLEVFAREIVPEVAGL